MPRAGLSRFLFEMIKAGNVIAVFSILMLLGKQTGYFFVFISPVIAWS
jgi:hypothetical protein